MWWAGVKKGIFPKPIKLSPRVTVWLETDIDRVGVDEVNIEKTEQIR